MKPLAQHAATTFLKLVAGLGPGEGKRIDNAPGIYMAVSVDCLDRGAAGTVYAVAHRFELNGDLCPDPDVEFLVVGDGAGPRLVFPTAIDQTLGYRRYVEFGRDGRPQQYSKAGQAGLALFCDDWMRNIRAQQGL